MTERKREIWVDNVKVTACVLVVLGHFFQSMVKAEVLSANDLYQWFNQTIYYFHIPLFFICSGYLYQKFSRVEDGNSWGKNVIKKALNLGIPYFTFSFVTWLLKTVFSSSANDRIGGLIDTLFLCPTSPYWYLYALFFIFLITPTFRNMAMAYIGVTAAFVLKLFGMIGGERIPAVSYILSNEIWFAAGMFLCVMNFGEWRKAKKSFCIGTIAGALFLIMSVMMYQTGISTGLLSAGMCVLGCCALILPVAFYYENHAQNRVLGILAQYTMPVFLMHTLFAAPLRAMLFRLGIRNAVIHVVLGIVISFAGPVAAAWIMEKSKWLEFFLYPGKFIKG